ncbi:sensor domain-containing diguanylate cyclase [Aureimonas flava]|nr:sensor domain-containing diguanylate cyclase [Aureimonas flava]
MTNGMRERPHLGPALLGAAYFALAAASILLTRWGAQIATMWPAGGLAVAVLTSADRAHLRRYALAVATGSLTANVVCGVPIGSSALYTAANVTETLLAVLLLSRGPFGGPSFVDARQVARFCAIAAFACLVSTAVASADTAWSDWRFSASWFAADLLGMVLAAPLVFLWLERDGGDTTSALTRNGAGMFALAMGGVAIVTSTVFAQSSLALLFLPSAALIAAAHATGPLGATAGTLVIAVIGSAAIASGQGPTMFIHSGPSEQTYFLQFYLAVLMGCGLSMAALQTARDRLMADLRNQTRLLSMAERVAKIGHWHLELATGAVTWSEEVFRLHGMDEGHEPSLATGLAAYHPDDREQLGAAIALATRTGDAFRMRARLIRPDGEMRYVDVSGEAIVADGVVRSLFGVLQDITRQVEIERGLEASREEALALASEATIRAETDALTGIANRRRILEAIDAAVRDAAASREPLSLAMFDIDHFKRVNDRHGHATGDAVLQGVASAAKAAVRGSDLVGRLGGEEFLVVLPGASQAVAMAIAERIRQEVRGDGREREGRPPVTVSLGVATLEGGEDGAALMRRADLALYRAKAEGRNVARLAA